jgi:hypothetical protein
VTWQFDQYLTSIWAPPPPGGGSGPAARPVEWPTGEGQPGGEGPADRRSDDGGFGGGTAGGIRLGGQSSGLRFDQRSNLAAAGVPAGPGSGQTGQTLAAGRTLAAAGAPWPVSGPSARPRAAGADSEGASPGLLDRWSNLFDRGSGRGGRGAEEGGGGGGGGGERL